MPINTVTITYICRGDDPCGTSSGGQHQEQLNPSSSEILDDPSCVSRVATPIISRRGDEKKGGRGERITNDTKNYVSWDHHHRHVGCVLGFPA